MTDDCNATYCITIWACSSVAEHGIADPAVAGSTPVAPSLLHEFHRFVINCKQTAHTSTYYL